MLWFPITPISLCMNQLIRYYACTSTNQNNLISDAEINWIKQKQNKTKYSIFKKNMLIS